MALTEKVVRDLKPGPKTRIQWDRDVKGFGVRITPAGAKAFVLNYRVGGKERRATLARVGEISLREVRERAGRELAAIRDGAADPLARREERRAAPTVAEGIERFFAEFAPERVALGRLSPRTVAEYRKQARAHVLPALGERKVADVSRRHVELMVANIAPSMRNRVLAFASRLFTLFERWEWRVQQTNPVRGIERAREEPRDRVLAQTEMQALAGALNGLEVRHPAPVAAIRMAALTGLRIGEVLNMRWEDIDFESGRLILPQTKTGRRVHDLSGPALEVLAAVPRVSASWCFSTSGAAANTYKHTRAVFAEAVKAAGLEDVRLHDLRRSFMTRAAAAGIGVHVLRDLLGHRTAAMADRYVRAVGSPVREARQQIGAAVAAEMAGGEPAEVVPLRGRRHDTR